MAVDPASAPDPAPAGDPAGMLAVGARLGAWVWWCDRLFAVAGGWVPSTPEPGVRIHLAELSRVVGEHALALRAHLPRPAPTDPDAWVRPSPGEAAAADVVAAADGTGERLAGLHRGVVPRLLVAWAAELRPGSTVSGRARQRAVGHARRDLADLWVEGEGLLQDVLAGDAGAVRRAMVQAASVEVAWAAPGG